MQLKWTERISLTQSGVNRIKAIAGVYRLINYSRADDKYYVYYVGQADDLNNRLSQHLPGNETNECCKKIS
jgi:excinuclease UvrABC nuclease subunit